MAQVRQHLNAKLTPLGRRAMVDLVIVAGWGVAATAQRYQVSAKTAPSGVTGSSPRAPTGWWIAAAARNVRRRGHPEATRRRVIELRNSRRRGAAWIAPQVALAPSTTTAA